MRIQTGYGQDFELKMKRLFATLPEKDRRRYAEIEAAKLGSGGISAISGLFGLDAKTVRLVLLRHKFSLGLIQWQCGQ